MFWANRPNAYIKRTADWEKYPNGRWGNAKSPYGTLKDHQLMRRHTSSEKRTEQAKAAWGQVTSVADVSAVFVNYAAGMHILTSPYDSLVT